MSNRLANLRHEGKITEIQYMTYVLFCGNDVGVRYLSTMLKSVVMEEPPIPKNARGTLFAWHDGRRSIWRDIQRMIDIVEKLLKGEKNE